MQGDPVGKAKQAANWVLNFRTEVLGERERKRFDALSPLRKACVQNAYVAGYVAGAATSNEMQHCVWSCKLVTCLGSKGAKDWTDDHEEDFDYADREKDKRCNKCGNDCGSGISWVVTCSACCSAKILLRCCDDNREGKSGPSISLILRLPNDKCSLELMGHN
jgi:hypothetical protein